MLDTSAEMFAAASACLLDNEPLRVDLSALDDEVNAREEAVRRAVLEHVVAAPKEETSFSLLLVSVVQDAERCGDLAKTLAKVSELAEAPRMGPHVERLAALRDRVAAAFPKARTAFLKGDSQLAREVMDGHARTKGDVADLIRAVTSDRDLSPNAAAVLAMSARIVGRVSSHLSNIVSAVALSFDQIRNAPTWKAG
jgi:phosphate uptake regulator